MNKIIISLSFILSSFVPLVAQNWGYFMVQGDTLIAHNNLKEGLKNYEKAIELINKSGKWDKNSLTRTYTAVGGTLIDMSKLETNETDKTYLIAQAIENLHEAIKTDSSFDNAYFLLGNAFFYQKNYEESIRSLEKCRELNPNHEFIAENLVIVYRESGKYFGEQKQDIPKALEYLDKSYQLNPNEVATLRLLGVANGNMGASENALNWFLKAAQLAPNNAAIWWDLGITYRNLGNKKKMQKCQKKALRLDPTYLEKMK